MRKMQGIIQLMKNQLTPIFLSYGWTCIYFSFNNKRIIKLTLFSKKTYFKLIKPLTNKKNINKMP